jgi:hypothetical protein
MKTFALFFLLIMVSCQPLPPTPSTYVGEWRAARDPSKTISISRSGKQFTFVTTHIESALAGVPGRFNSARDEYSLIFEDGNGNRERFVYNVHAKKMLALGMEFEKVR